MKLTLQERGDVAIGQVIGGRSTGLENAANGPQFGRSGTWAYSLAVRAPAGAAANVSITREEIEELFFIEAGLRDEKSRRFYGKVASSLLMKGLLVLWGMSVRMTPLGQETLLRIRHGDVES